MHRGIAVVLGLVAALTSGQRVFAAVIDVFPAAGTPFQDAVNAAVDGDMLIVHAGTYDETVVVNKSVKIVVPAGEGVVVGPGLGSWALDIAADGVQVRGALSPVTQFLCAKEGAIRVHNRSKIKLQGIVAVCPPVGDYPGLDVQNVTKLKIKLVSVAGPIGARIAQIAEGARVIVKSSNFQGETGLLLENIAPGATLGRSGVKLIGGNGFYDYIPSTTSVALRLVNADGVLIKKNSQFSAITGITLDATSDNNLIKKNFNIHSAVDLGTGNCWKANSQSGSIPMTCP